MWPVSRNAANGLKYLSTVDSLTWLSFTSTPTSTNVTSTASWLPPANQWEGPGLLPPTISALSLRIDSAEKKLAYLRYHQIYDSPSIFYAFHSIIKSYVNFQILTLWIDLIDLKNSRMCLTLWIFLSLLSTLEKMLIWHFIALLVGANNLNSLNFKVWWTITYWDTIPKSFNGLFEEKKINTYPQERAMDVNSFLGISQSFHL